MKFRRTFAAVVGCSLLLGLNGACNSGGSSSSADSNSPIQRVRLKYDLDVKGAMTLTGSAVADSSLSRTAPFGGSAGEGLGLQPYANLPIGGGQALVAMFITPYKGDGEYTVNAGSLVNVDMSTGTTAPGQKPEPQSVSFQWTPAGTEIPTFFIDRLAPCTVVIKDDGRRGNVRCPQFSTGSPDMVVDLSFSWTPAD